MGLKKFIFLFLILANLGWTKTFKTKFVTLELPPNWDCQQEELDWVCQPENPNLRNEAIVVVVTKATNASDDTLLKYEEYLKTPKQMRDLVGNSYTSQIKYTRQKKIGEALWVDSLQVGSEVPGFISRYVASVKEQVAALISYHVAESVFSKWADPLDKMIDSAELRFDPKAFEEIMKSRNMSLFGKAGGPSARTVPVANSAAAKKVETEGAIDMTTMVGGAVLLIAAIGYFIYKKRQNS